MSSFGTEMGQLLSLLYAELRGGIHYAFEEKTDYLTILYELFIEVYNCFENAALEEASEQRTADEKESGAAGAEKQIPSAEQIREILYWYASDYCDVFLADRILEQIDPSFSFAADLIETADLDSDELLSLCDHTGSGTVNHRLQSHLLKIFDCQTNHFFKSKAVADIYDLLF